MLHGGFKEQNSMVFNNFLLLLTKQRTRKKTKKLSVVFNGLKWWSKFKIGENTKYVHVRDIRERFDDIWEEWSAILVWPLGVQFKNYIDLTQKNCADRCSR